MRIRARQAFTVVCTLGLLGFGLWLYSQPSLAVLLAEQLWACF